MATKAGKIGIELEAKTAKFQSDMAKARGIVQTNATGMAGAMERVKGSFAQATGGIGSFKGALAGLAGVLSAGAIVRGFMNIANAMDRMEEASQKTGVGVENLQIFSMAAKLASVDVEAMTKGLVKLQRTMFDYTAGLTEAKQGFDNLGISVKDSDGQLKMTDAVLLEIADKFQAMPDGASKSALAMKMFGRAGAEMIPMLNMGSEGIMKLRDEMGYLFTQDDANRAAVFTDKIDLARNVISGMATQVVSGALPAMLNLAEAFKVGGKEGDHFRDTGEALGNILKWGARQAYAISAAIQIATVKLVDWYNKIGNISRWYIRYKFGVKMDKVETGTAASSTVDDILDSYQAKIDALDKPIDIPAPRNRGGGSGDETAEASKKKSNADAALKRAEQAILALQKQVELNGVLTETEKMRWEITKGAYKDFDEATKGKLISLAGELDALKNIKDAEELLEEQRKEAMSAAAEKMREIESIVDSVRTPQEKYNETIRRLNELLSEGAILFDTYQRAVAQADETLKKTTKDGEDGFKKLQQAIEGWGKDSASAIADFALKGSTSFSDMIESMISDLLKMMIYQNITGPLFQGISAGIGGFFGGAGAANYVPAGRAIGGPVSSGRMYEVNETGFPELLSIGNKQFLMMGNRSGNVVAATGGSSGGGGTGGSSSVNVIINNNTNSDVSQQSEANGNGGLDLIVTIDNLVAKNLNKHGSNSSRALRKGYGAKPVLTGR